MRLSFNPTTGDLDWLGPKQKSVERLSKRFTTDILTLPLDFVVVSGANTVERIADNSIISMPNGIFGIGFYKPSSVEIEVIFAGIIGGYSGFIAGSALFVSSTGLPTHSVPSFGMVQQIGFAVSSTEFFVSLMQPMRRS